jgi:RNA polymerase sigma-70 factor (ECF subfamily)
MSECTRIQNDFDSLYPKLFQVYGFLPNLFRVQDALPRVITAQEGLVDAILLRENRLLRAQKESILSTVAEAWQQGYCRALMPTAIAMQADDKHGALRTFALKLARYSPCFSRKDVDTVKETGLTEEAVLEAIAITALGRLLCTLAEGFRPALDSQVAPPPASTASLAPENLEPIETPGPHFHVQTPIANDSGPCVSLRNQFGFVPNVFKIQGLRPDLLEPQVHALELILCPEDHLNFVQKGKILVALSRANLNTYWVAVGSQVLEVFGTASEELDQIIDDPGDSTLSQADKALLSQTSRLCSLTGSPDHKFDQDVLCQQGFTRPQIVEAIAVAALTNFLNIIQAGVGAVPDFPARRTFSAKDLYLRAGESRPTSDAVPPDPDNELVVRVQQGDTEAFEELVRRHTRRVFGVLAGIVGNVDDVRDITQEVFLKAFEHIDRFQRRSKFSTWLISIAVNTGTELLRQRKPIESLTEDEDEDFRPRQIQSWADNPEEVLAASQRNQLVREGVLRLPQKYRVAVILRDINQLSTEEAAAALGLSVPALKARLLRGRLMLRESLSPHFLRVQKRSPDAQLR